MTVRLVTYYTPSHADMCERFVLSRAWGFRERRSFEAEQTCPSASFRSEGWNTCTAGKFRALESLDADGRPTVYVDADVALFPGFRDYCQSVIDEIPQSAVAFSDDVVQHCTGIMLFRATPQVLGFFRLAADLVPIWNLPDQDVVHQLFQQANQTGGGLPVKPVVLHRDRVCNWATVSAPQIPAPWDGEPFTLPPTCLAWHANWTIGVERKSLMLERVVSYAGQHSSD
jgi:hypothetical protein